MSLEKATSLALPPNSVLGLRQGGQKIIRSLSIEPANNFPQPPAGKKILINKPIQPGNSFQDIDYRVFEFAEIDSVLASNSVDQWTSSDDDVIFSQEWEMKSDLEPAPEAPMAFPEVDNPPLSFMKTENSFGPAMMCVNPREVQEFLQSDEAVEGPTSGIKHEPEVTEDQKALDPFIVHGQDVEPDFIQQVMECQVDESLVASLAQELGSCTTDDSHNLDLLDMILDDTIDANSFMQTVGDYSTHSPDPPQDVYMDDDHEVVVEILNAPQDRDDLGHQQDLAQLRRRRGRPKKNPAAESPTKRPRGRPPASSSLSALHQPTGDQAVDSYRRTRVLNNEASRRCRANRKQKEAANKAELERQIKLNKELKLEIKSKNALIARLRSALDTAGLKI